MDDMDVIDIDADLSKKTIVEGLNSKLLALSPEVKQQGLKESSPIQKQDQPLSSKQTSKQTPKQTPVKQSKARTAGQNNKKENKKRTTPKRGRVKASSNRNTGTNRLESKQVTGSVLPSAVESTRSDQSDFFKEVHVDNKKPSWRGQGVKTGLRFLKPTLFNGLTIPTVQRFCTHLGGLPLSYAQDVKKIPADEYLLPVRGHVFQPISALKETAMLYFHGGAYELGLGSATKKFASHLAKAINTTVYVPGYRLAPENPYPAALDDCFDSYCHLVKHYNPNKLFIAGDSSGAGLAVSVLARAQKFGLPMPKKLVLLSPWLDFSATGESYRNRKRRDPIISGGWLNTALKRYTGTPWLRSLEHEKIAAISPLNESIQNFPETMIQVGSEEILLSDAYALANKLTAGHVRGRLEVWDGLWHCWPLYTFLPESKVALDHIATFIGYQEGEAPL